MALKHVTGELKLRAQHLNFVIEYSKDFDARRAALASGMAPDSGYSVVQREDVQAALAMILERRLESSDITAEWVLMEAVDNHLIARQMQNIAASNTALNIIAKHKLVDAMAREKVDVNVTTSKDIIERLMRGRQRLNKEDGSEVSFL